MTEFPEVPGVRFAKIEGFDGYVVGDDGSVWSSRWSPRPGTAWRRLRVSQRKDKGRYFRVFMRRSRSDQKVCLRYVHRLVLAAFVGPAGEGEQCRHLDGDVTNNRLSNLAWGTASDNAQDRSRHGTMPRGDSHCGRKLTTASVRAARVLRSQGWLYRDIGDLFGVSWGTIRLAVKRKNWRHVI